VLADSRVFVDCTSKRHFERALALVQGEREISNQDRLIQAGRRFLTAKAVRNDILQGLSAT
jgi:hypothetical protein